MPVPYKRLAISHINPPPRSLFTSVAGRIALEPQIAPAQNYDQNDRQIRAAEALIRNHENDIGAAWLKGAPSAKLTNVERPQPHHLCGPDLDVDLAVESIRHPEKFPLVARSST